MLLHPVLDNVILLVENSPCVKSIKATVLTQVQALHLCRHVHNLYAEILVYT